MKRQLLFRGLLRDNRGAAAIEAAVVIPTIVILLMVAFEGAQIMWTKSTLQHAAAYAARWGSTQLDVCASDASVTCPTTSDVIAAAQGQATGFSLTSSNFLSPATDPTPTTISAGCGVRVHISYTMSTVGLDILLGNGITINETVCFPT